MNIYQVPESTVDAIAIVLLFILGIISAATLIKSILNIRHDKSAILPLSISLSSWILMLTFSSIYLAFLVQENVTSVFAHSGKTWALVIMFYSFVLLTVSGINLAGYHTIISGRLKEIK